MDRWKAEMGRGRETRRVEESRSEKRKSQKKEDADARKGSGLPLPRVTCAPGFVNTNLTLEHKTTKVESVREKNPTEEYPG